MQKTQINPWSWQDRRGYSQAWKVEEGRTVVFVSGQVSVSAEGEVLHADDFAGQVEQTLENLRTVLAESGASFESVVKIGVFLTDMRNLPEFGRIKASLFPGPQPASTAIGVTALAMPELMIEVEAIAVI